MVAGPAHRCHGEPPPPRDGGCDRPEWGGAKELRTKGPGLTAKSSRQICHPVGVSTWGALQ